MACTCVEVLGSVVPLHAMAGEKVQVLAVETTFHENPRGRLHLHSIVRSELSILASPTYPSMIVGAATT